MAKHSEKVARPKVTIIPGRGVSQTINYLLEDRDDLEWLVAVGRNKNGEIFFYDTGGDIVEDLGTLEYLKERDRKSTRLNSSHPSSSYAVFCLKKKTQN